MVAGVNNAMAPGGRGRVDGKVAVVTGAAAGIGHASARLLAAEGAALVLADIDREGLRSVCAEVEAFGGSAVGVVLDMGDRDAVHAMVLSAVAHYGRLDILFNNAAAMNLNQYDVGVGDVDPEIWEQIIRVNLTGPMLASRAAIPVMIASGGGSIIHTASAAGLVAEGAGLTAYGCSKAGVMSLSRSIAVQYGQQGIRSNAISPGLILNDRTLGKFDRERLAIYADHHMTTRLGRPEDIAQAVLYLASDESGFVTGTVLNVDGGLTSYMPAYPSVRKHDQRARSKVAAEEALAGDSTLDAFSSEV